MAWAKFDDRWATHPKLLAAGLEAKGLDASGICYAAGQETDGFVPDTALIILGAGHRSPRKVAERLVEVGRWIRDDERKGYVIHDFDRYNFTRAQGEAKRTRDAERKAAARKKQGRDAQGRITSGPTEGDVQADTDTGPPGIRAESERTPTLVPPVPTRPDPTPSNRSSSSLDRVGERPAEEEDHDGQEPDPETLVCRLVAERRHDKRSEPIPEGIRRTKWLEATAEQVHTSGGANIRALLGQDWTVEAIVDLFEPSPKPGQSPGPSRDPLPPAWELDEAGNAVPLGVSA